MGSGHSSHSHKRPPQSVRDLLLKRNYEFGVLTSGTFSETLLVRCPSAQGNVALKLVYLRKLQEFVRSKSKVGEHVKVETCDLVTMATQSVGFIFKRENLFSLFKIIQAEKHRGLEHDNLIQLRCGFQGKHFLAESF